MRQPISTGCVNWEVNVDTLEKRLALIRVLDYPQRCVLDGRAL